MAKNGKFSRPRSSHVQMPAEPVTDIVAEAAPASAGASPTPEKTVKPKRRKPNRNLTLIFYTLYVLMILSVAAGIFFHARWLEDQLVLYEESRPEVAVELIFEEHFAQPDWGRLYYLADIESTDWEGRDAFVTYMEETLSGAPLHWERTFSPIRGQHAYFLKDGDTVIGLFALENIAPYGTFPVWSLSTLQLYVQRTCSITVLAPRGYTVSVNGAALEDIHVIRRLRQAHGDETVTWYCYQLSGLLKEPEITAADRDGNSLSVVYDPESGIYLAESEDLRYDADALIREEVRVSFLYGDTVLFTNFHDPDTTSLLAPVISPPQGQRFTGWYRREAGENGEMIYTLVFTPEENGNISLPIGTVLEPMTLYARFEDANNTDGGTE